MEVEIRLDGKRVYAMSFDLCRMSRDSIAPEPTQRILAFNLSSKNRSFFGERKGQVLEGNIWEAGEDKSDLILGVSFAEKDRVWCNTLHILDPNKPSESELADGLVVKTFPRLGQT